MINYFLIFLGFGFFVLLTSLRREWGVYLIILLLPSYQIRFALGPIPMTFLEGMILVLLGVELFFLIKDRGLGKAWQNLTANQLSQNLLIVFFLLAAFVSVFVSPVPLKGAGIFKAFFMEAILFYFLFRLIINNEQRLNGIWRSLTLLTLYLSLFGIYQFITLANLPFSWWAVHVASRRITSLLNHPNALALLLGPVLALLLMLPRKTRGQWLTLALGLIALYLSFSRAAWLALALAILALGLLTEHRKKILAGVVLLALLVVIIPYSRGKLLELTSGTDPSQQNRLVLWRAAQDMLKKSPVYGVGLMGFHEYYRNYPLGPDRVVQNYPHNFFLNFWVETGLVGMVAMLGLLYLFYKNVRGLLNQNKRRYLALASAAGMGVILLHGLVDVSYFKNDLSVLFWLIYALPNLTFLENP